MSAPPGLVLCHTPMPHHITATHSQIGIVPTKETTKLTFSFRISIFGKLR